MVARTIALLLIGFLAQASAGTADPSPSPRDPEGPAPAPAPAAPAPAPEPPPSPPSGADPGAPPASEAATTVAAERVFRPNWHFEVVLGDTPVPEAVCYNSGGLPGMLIVAPPLGRPVFARMTDRKVVAVEGAGVRKDGDALVVASSAFGEPLADWLTEEGAARFTLEGRTWLVRERPIALGRLSLPVLVERYPGLRGPMTGYAPDAESVKFLASFPKPVELRLYFGTWCPVCEQTLPGLLRVLADAGNRNLHPVFEGMPREFKSDPSAVSAGVRKLPTLVVTVQGREIGRIEGRPEESWEKHLWRLLARVGG